MSRRLKRRPTLASKSLTQTDAQVMDHVDPPSESGLLTDCDTLATHQRSPNFHQRDALRLLQPITTFSPTQGYIGDAAMTTSISTNVTPGIVNNSRIIEILVHLLCQQRETDPGRRDLLFRALCAVIKKCNASFYLPLHAFPHMQDIQANLLKQFEKLFEKTPGQIPQDPANLVIPRLQLSTSPLSELRLSDIYQHPGDRYTQEFVELDILGRGGFGVVMKVKNKLDGFFYAIKIIPIKDDNGRSLLREVQALAQLDHPNIVRYHSTWVQLYALPSHLSLDDELTERLERKPCHLKSPTSEPVHSLSTASSVRIEELSSSTNTEDSNEETSGGISFREESRSSRKFINRRQGPRTYNIIYEENMQTCRKASQAEVMIYKKGVALPCNSLKKNNFKFMKKKEVLNDRVFQPVTNISFNIKNFNNKESLNAKSSSDESIVFSDISHSNVSSKSEMDHSNCKYPVSPSSENLSSVSPDTEKAAVALKNCHLGPSLPSFVDNHQKSLLAYQPLRMKVQQHHSHSQLAQMTLFIQMGLCGESLKDWLLRRNQTFNPSDFSGQTPANREKYLGLFKQILLAVQYIHCEKIIHRDIKPANIFFTLDGKHIQLGDFGLARPLPNLTASGAGEANIVEEICLTPISEHAPNTRGVGTPIYAAPELKIGGKYDAKSDMHNLGIILLELFQPFQTGSERIHVISALKTKRQLDQGLRLMWSDIAYWILQLTDPEPGNRPSADEVLKSSLFTVSELERPLKLIQTHFVNMQSDCSTITFSSKEDLENVCVKHSPQETRPHAMKRDTSVEFRQLLREKSEEVCQKDVEIAKLKEENLKQKETIAKLQQQIENMKTGYCEANEKQPE